MSSPTCEVGFGGGWDEVVAPWTQLETKGHWRSVGMAWDHELTSSLIAARDACNGVSRGDTVYLNCRNIDVAAE